MLKHLIFLAPLMAPSVLAIQGVHLVNCGYQGAAWGSSEVNYYADDSNAVPGKGPVYRYNFGHVQQWEGVGCIGGDFTNNGGHWTACLAGDAQSHQLYTAVGDGYRELSTSTEHYKCYLDDKHVSYSSTGEGGAVWVCNSIYYCLRQ